MEAYGFEKSALKLVYSYLTNRKQRVKVGSTYSTFQTFNVHIKELCKKMNQKLCAFWRIRPLLNREKAKILRTSIVMSNLSYCPLIWMFCSKPANKEINRTNKRALRLLYKDYDSSFEQLLEKDGSITVHQRNLQNIMTEIYKTISQINPAYIWEFFLEKDMPYNLRTKVLCRLPQAQKIDMDKTPSHLEVVYYGIRYRTR